MLESSFCACIADNTGLSSFVLGPENILHRKIVLGFRCFITLHMHMQILWAGALVSAYFCWHTTF